MVKFSHFCVMAAFCSIIQARDHTSYCSTYCNWYTLKMARCHNTALLGGAAAVSLFYLALYVISTFLSIILALIITSAVILFFDYLHFIAIDYGSSKGIRSLLMPPIDPLLILSRCGLLFLNIAVLFKWFSAFLPHIDGVELPEIISFVADDNCFCRMCLALSMMSYVVAFYILKFISGKRVIYFLYPDAIYAPLSVVVWLLHQTFTFSLFQFALLNYSSSHCTDEARSEYDIGSPYGCHDSF
eukprot:632651_1